MTMTIFVEWQFVCLFVVFAMKQNTAESGETTTRREKKKFWKKFCFDLLQLLVFWFVRVERVVVITIPARKLAMNIPSEPSEDQNDACPLNRCEHMAEIEN